MKNDPIAGYTYQAACYLPEEIIPRMVPGAVTYPDAEQVERFLTVVAPLWDVEDRDDLDSYDSNDFPKPIYLSQLTCYDNYWTKQAPAHDFGPDKVCLNCGIGR